MVGSSEHYAGRTRKVVGSGGSYLGVLPIIGDRDPDPTSNVIYLGFENVEIPARAKPDGTCVVTNLDIVKRLKRIISYDS